MQDLANHRLDFMDYPMLENELTMAFSEAGADSILPDNKKRLSAMINSKPTTNNEPGQSDLQMSQYTLEVFLTYVEKENFSLLKDLVFMVGISPISLKKELQPKEVSTSGYFTRMSQEEKDAINKKQIATGLEKSDFSYWSKLLKFSAPTKPGGVGGAKGVKATSILSPSHEESLQFSLAKRITLLGDQTPRLVTTQPQAPASLTYKMEFTQNYLTTSKAVHQQTLGSQPSNPLLPSIMKFGVEDYYGAVTVMESNLMMRLILFGTARGLVKGVFLTRSAEAQQVEQGISIQRQKESEQQNAQGDTGMGSSTQQQAAIEEYEMSLDMVEFVGHKSPITAISLKHDSTRFVSGSLDGQIRCWDVTRSACVYILQEHFEAVLSIKMSPKRDLFASSGSESVIILWNETSGTRNLSLIGHTNDVVCMEFSYNMRYLFSSSLDSTLRLWCTSTGDCVRVIRTSSPLLHFCVTLVGDIVIGAAENNELNFIDVTRSKLHRFYSFAPKESASESRIRSVAFSPDEKYCSIIKKDQVAIIPTEEIYKLKAEFEVLERKEDEAGIRELSNRDYKQYSLLLFQNDKFDFMSQSFGFHNSLVVFTRNPGAFNP
jgi:WD domain, G-beta repeat